MRSRRPVRLLGRPAAAAGTPSGVPVIVDANDRPMPLDPYLLDPAQIAALDKAQSVLVSRCMGKLGYDYPVATESADPSGMGADAPTTRVDGYFGFQSMSHARKWGYHPKGGFPEADDSAGTHLPAQESTALNGCAGQARQSLTGGSTGDLGDPDFVVRLKFDTLGEGTRDPRTLAVFAKWSACMKARGHRYADPMKASGDPAWSRTRLPGPQEIAVAVADQECRRDTNVVGVWYAVDYGYQQQAVQQNSARLAAAKAQTAAHLAAADRVLH